MVLGELYRRGGDWRFRAVGQGYAAGLAGLATDFGIAVEAPEEGLERPRLPLQPETGLDDSALDPPPGSGVAEVGVYGIDEPSEPKELPDLTMPVPAAAPKRNAVRTKKRLIAPVVHQLTLADDDSWRAARLFPVAGIGGADEQERRATSALLAVIMGVKEFGRAITGRLGAPAGTLETYLELRFQRGDDLVIPDGLLRVERAGRRWTALVEVKTGTGVLQRPQIESYLDVAREKGYDAVVTISNELPPSAGQHPVGVDRRKLKKVSLLHLSWAEIVHETTMQLNHRGVADPTQRWLLDELRLYLQHPRSGASGFEDMGASWVTVRDAVTAGTLRASDRNVADVARSWERLVRQVCLRKTGELNVDVTPLGARRSAADPAARTAQHVKSLVDQGSLTAGLRFQGAAGPLHLTANLRTGQVAAAFDVAAPTEGRQLTRVNWLLRQLSDAPPSLKIEVLASHGDVSCSTPPLATPSC